MNRDQSYFTLCHKHLWSHSTKETVERADKIVKTILTYPYNTEYITVVLKEIPMDVRSTPASLGMTVNNRQRIPVNAVLRPSDLRFPRRVSTIHAPAFGYVRD